MSTEEIITEGVASEASDAVTLNMQDLIALPPSKRAAVALKSENAEKQLRELVEKSSQISNVVDMNGRDEAHRAGMSLKNARVAITKTGKAAREDATAFSTAVIAEEKRLLEISGEEEKRVFGLRDTFDDNLALEKAKQEQKEAERKAAIRTKIEEITNLPGRHAGAGSVTISAALADLAQRSILQDEFAEFTEEAKIAVDTAASALLALRGAAREKEQAEVERLRIQAEEQARLAAEAEAQRIEAERLEEERRVQEEAQASIKRLQAQQQRTADALFALQRLGAANGNSNDIRAEIDAAGAISTTEEEFGTGAPIVKMAKDMALQVLSKALEQAMHAEGEAAAAALEEVVAEVASVRCVDHSTGSPVEVSMDIFNMDVFNTRLVNPADIPAMQLEVTDEEIIERIGMEYSWSRADTIARLKAINFDEVVA